MPRGGARPGAGRKPGMVSAAKKDLIDTAKEYAGNALAVLVEVAMDKAAPHSARVSAATAILDRGYGKPTATLQHGQDPESPLPASITLNIVSPGEQA